MRIFLLLAAVVVLLGTVGSCSIRDCAYYGGADANVRCVVTGPSPTGGGY